MTGGTLETALRRVRAKTSAAVRGRRPFPGSWPGDPRVRGGGRVPHAHRIAGTSVTAAVAGPGRVRARPGIGLCPDRPRVHAGVRRAVHDQLRPRRRLHVRRHDLVLRGQCARVAGPGHRRQLPQQQPADRHAAGARHGGPELDDRCDPPRADRLPAVAPGPTARAPDHRHRRLALHQQQRPRPVRGAGQGLPAVGRPPGALDDLSATRSCPATPS